MSSVSRLVALAACGFVLAAAVGWSASPARAEDPAAAAAPAATETPAPGKAKKKRAAQPARSLEARHAVCMAFVQRHGLSCDPWQEPTCGAETGYFRPMECVRPRSQQ